MGLAASAALMGQAQAATNPVVLLLDLEVDPAKEKELLANFKQTFSPAIRKQPGFVDVKLMKLRTELAGKAPAGSRYRLLISFQTEEQRQKWVATDLHQQAWPTIEKTLKGAKYTALLYDAV
jgi:heme-degrading monooxygenase HmoA